MKAQLIITETPCTEIEETPTNIKIIKKL